MLKANYHTHTWRCHHAGNDPDLAYVSAAVENGIQVLGFSDHIPWPYRSGYRDKRSRMDLSQLPDYVGSVRSLSESFRDRIRIYCGMECEYFTEYMDHLKRIHDQMDYLILGYHYLGSNENREYFFLGEAKTSEQFDRYADGICSAMGSGLFTYAAHPDLILNKYPEFDDKAEKLSRQICSAAHALNIPLEYNLYGLYKKKRAPFPGLGYPCFDFWKIAAESGCSAIIGCDAHMPSLLGDAELQEYAVQQLQEAGIPVLETLPGLS